jgi:hypothetical protein
MRIPYFTGSALALALFVLAAVLPLVYAVRSRDVLAIVSSFALCLAGLIIIAVSESAFQEAIAAVPWCFALLLGALAFYTKPLRDSAERTRFRLWRREESRTSEVRPSEQEPVERPPREPRSYTGVHGASSKSEARNEQSDGTHSPSFR